MRIGLVCSDRGPCPPIKGGAIQLLISKVAPLLAKKNHVTVFSISDTELANKEKIKGVQYVRFPQKTFLKMVCRSVEKGKFDLIQIYNRANWISDIRQVAPKAKIILSLHNLIKKDTEKEAKSTIQKADLILTVSKFVLKDTEKRFPVTKGKIKVLYTGANANEYAPVWTKKGKKWRKEVRKKYNIGAKDPVLLFVGRLVSYKGCHIVLKALKNLLKEHKKARLIIIGSKWYADHSKDSYVKGLHKFAKKMKGHVIFTSYVPVEEIPKYYSAADIFVCASQWEEPLARVHYEAMAAGLPMITTKRGGNHEVVRNKETGIVIKDYKNPNEFSKAGSTLFDDPKRMHKMGSRGRLLVEKKYNFNRIANDLEAIYSSLIKKRKK